MNNNDMQEHLLMGMRGEDEAERYLKDQGYEILERNYRYRRYEIDMIVRKDEWTVFVEVKTRKGNYYGTPETFVNAHKINCLQIAAAHYRSKHSSPFWRYDIVSVNISSTLVRIRHFEDAIWA